VARRHSPLSVDAEEYLTYLAIERGRAANSIVSYRHDLANYEEFLTERGVALGDVTPKLLEDYLGRLRAAGLSPATRARALVAIRGLHGFGVDERGMLNDPTEDVERPSIPASVPKALSEADIARVLGAVNGSDPRSLRDKAMLELLYASGLRISELVGLSLADLDLDDQLLRAFGKGSKERLVPFGRPAATALAEWLGRGGRPLLSPAQFARRDDAEALFLSPRGRRMTRQGAWTVVRQAAEAVGLEDRVTPHVFRHSFATHLLDHGADVRVVQELLGHASITTTQIYTKVSQEHLHRVYRAAHPRAAARRGSTGRIGATQVTEENDEHL
jgi:integrase/recombinase XerD